MAGQNDKAIPIGDIAVCYGCCCNILGVSCKYPECIGIMENDICLCMKNQVIMYKCMDANANQDGKCCVFFEGGSYCVKPATCWSSQSQFCCIDHRAAIPPTDKVPCVFTCLPFCVLCAGYKCTPGCGKTVRELLGADFKETKIVGAKDGGRQEQEKELSDVQFEDLLVCIGTGCGIWSLYTKFPECCGSKVQGTVCCYQGEQAACKPICQKNEEGICCIIFEGGTYCVKPSTCCAAQQQFFCADGRVAFPCNETVPCVITPFPFMVCCADYRCKPACCAKGGDLIPKKVAHAQLS